MSQKEKSSKNNYLKVFLGLFVLITCFIIGAWYYYGLSSYQLDKIENFSEEIDEKLKEKVDNFVEAKEPEVSPPIAQNKNAEQPPLEKTTVEAQPVKAKDPNLPKCNDISDIFANLFLAQKEFEQGKLTSLRIANLKKYYSSGEIAEILAKIDELVNKKLFSHEELVSNFDDIAKDVIIEGRFMGQNEHSPLVKLEKFLSRVYFVKKIDKKSTKDATIDVTIAQMHFELENRNYGKVLQMAASLPPELSGFLESWLEELDDVNNVSSNFSNLIDSLLSQKIKCMN